MSTLGTNERSSWVGKTYPHEMLVTNERSYLGEVEISWFGIHGTQHRESKYHDGVSELDVLTIFIREWEGSQYDEYRTQVMVKGSECTFNFEIYKPQNGIKTLVVKFNNINDIKMRISLLNLKIKPARTSKNR